VVQNENENFHNLGIEPDLHDFPVFIRHRVQRRSPWSWACRSLVFHDCRMSSGHASQIRIDDVEVAQIKNTRRKEKIRFFFDAHLSELLPRHFIFTLLSQSVVCFLHYPRSRPC